jgi:hypothetical protein
VRRQRAEALLAQRRATAIELITKPWTPSMRGKPRIRSSFCVCLRAPSTHRSTTLRPAPISHSRLVLAVIGNGGVFQGKLGIPASHRSRDTSARLYVQRTPHTHLPLNHPLSRFVESTSPHAYPSVNARPRILPSLRASLSHHRTAVPLPERVVRLGSHQSSWSVCVPHPQFSDTTPVCLASMQPCEWC